MENEINKFVIQSALEKSINSRKELSEEKIIESEG